MAVTLTLSGDAFHRLAEVAAAFPAQAGAALRAEAEIEMTEAKLRTPVKTGALRGSGTVVGPVEDDGAQVVVLAFGTPVSVSAAYAVEVHENLEAFHRVGQAKFLESVILESAPYLAQRVAERIQLGAGAQYAPSTEEITASENAVRALEQLLGGE
jgi:hypothetical protein